MGNILPGLDADKKEVIETIAKDFLATFSAAYVQAYGVEVARLKLNEIAEESCNVEKSKRELKYRENVLLTDPLKTGNMIKQGAVVKNWKKRFFVVRPDYSIEYYENQEAFEKGFKSKGVIVPAGYKVEEDADSAIAERLRDIAKKLGVEENDLPLPDKYPTHTFELYHDRRRPYYVTAEGEEDKKEWIQIIKECCHRCRGFKNTDPIAKVTFENAFRVARRESGFYYSNCRGTEEQILSDSIVGAINHQVMSDIYSSLASMPGGYAIRKKVREQVIKSLDSLVMAMVIPSYKGQVETTSKMKGPLEEMIMEKKDDILGVQNKISAQFCDELDGTIGGLMGDVNSDIDQLEFKLRDILKKCMPIMRENVVKVFEHVPNKAKDNDDIEASLPKYFKILDRAKYFNSYKNKLTVMYEPASNVLRNHPFLNDVSWSCRQIFQMGRDMMDQVIDASAYTFEELFKELVKGTDALKNGKSAADIMTICKDQVLPKLHADMEFLPDVISFKMTQEVIIVYITKKLEPLTKDLRKKLIKSIPETTRKVVSVEERYENYIKKVAFDLIKRASGKDESKERAIESDVNTTPDDIAQESTPEDSLTKNPSTEL